MPLTKSDDSYLDGIKCACKKRFADHAEYYAHVGDCPILRCCWCLEWIDGTHVTVDNHVCASLKLIRLRDSMTRSFRDLQNTLREI